MHDQNTAKSWLVNWFASLPLIVQKVAAYLPLRVGGLVLQLATSVLLARILGPENFGAYTYAFVWAALFGTFLTLGLEQMSVREIPRYAETRDYAHLRGFIRSIWATLVVMGFVVTVGFAWAEHTGFLVLAPGWAIISALMIAHSVSLVLAALLVALQHINTAHVLETLPRAILFLVGVVVLGSVLAQDGVTGIFILFVLASLLPIVVMGWLVWRLLARMIDKPVRPKFRLWVWYGAGISIALNVFVQIIMENTDILMIGTMLGNYETGVYRAAARGAFMVSFAAMMAIKVLGPILSQAVATENRREAQRLLGLAAAMSAVMGLGAGLILWLGGGIYLGLFGEPFLAGRNALNILLAGRIAEALTLAAGLVLILHHHERLVLTVNLGGVMCNVVLNYVLLQRIGIEGAAIATSVTTVLVNLVLLWAVITRVRLDPTPVASVTLAYSWLKNRST